MAQPPDWQRYEEAAAEILRAARCHFGLADVEGKQSVPGESGTEWEIDAKGVNENGVGFVIIEARRHTTRKLDQEEVASLAFRITDTGATGAILVTPLGLQDGAQKVAKTANVAHVKLSADATPKQFAMEFLGNVLIQLAPLPPVQFLVGTPTIVITDNTSPPKP